MRKDTRVIILCGDNNSNWEGKTPKYLAKINGERLIDRTIRQLRKLHIEDIVVISKNYRFKGVKNYYPKPNPYNFQADELISSINKWNKTSNTIVLYGDTYFTDKAIQTVISYRGAHWKLFCRPYASKYIDKGWSESFAIYISPEAHQKAVARLTKLVGLCNEDKLWTPNAFAWCRAMAGIPDNRMNIHLKESSLYTVIDDLTTSITCKNDYNELIKAIRNT